MFFVALSRARDYLLLSYPQVRNAKPTKISPLLEPLLETLQACNAHRIEWKSAKMQSEPSEIEEETNTNVTQNLPMTLPLAAVEQYQECPRQFYYQRVARLKTKREESDYLVFHQSVQQTVAWVQTEHAAGNAPDDAIIQTKLNECWQQNAPETDNAALRLLHRKAAELVTLAHEITPPTGKPVPGLTLSAELPNGRIELKADHAAQLPDGTLRLERHHKRAAKKDDHTEPRLALLREAAKQQNGANPVEIALVSLADGESKTVPEVPRFEPARLAKYDAALQEIKAGRFPALPDNRRCPACPYFFLCPA